MNWPGLASSRGNGYKESNQSLSMAPRNRLKIEVTCVSFARGAAVGKLPIILDALRQENEHSANTILHPGDDVSAQSHSVDTSHSTASGNGELLQLAKFRELLVV